MAEWKSDKGRRSREPIESAAAGILEERFRILVDGLPLVVRVPLPDIEDVHKFRVATRRASTAVKHFAPYLPKKLGRRLRRSLRVLRRAAGHARDWDVFLLDLIGRPPADGMAPWSDFLRGYALGERIAAQKTLAAIVASEDPDVLCALWERAPRSLESGGKPNGATIGDLARSAVGRALEEFEAEAVSDWDEASHLHPVRIAAKRLRYTLELFEPFCAEGAWSDWHPLVEELQEILGKVNDTTVALGRLDLIKESMKPRDQAEWRRIKPGLASLARERAADLPVQVGAFETWWRGWKEFRDRHPTSELFAETS